MELDVSQHRSPFLQLPLELLLQIWEYLSVDDALSLRLVCHCIEALLFEPFCREFFSERRFSITHHSLQVLIDITRCPRLKNCLTHLTIGFDRLHSSDALPRYTDYWDPVNNTLRGSSEPLVKAGIDPYKLEAFTLEQNFLVSSGQFLIMLSEALGNLTCLKELSLRDHNARRRITHAGMNPLLLSYGWSHILRETGIDFTGVGSHLDSYDDRFVDIVFSAILLALARGQTQIDALTVEIRQGTIGLSSSAFSIPVFFYRDIHPTLFNLRSLDLSVSFTQVPIGSYSNPSNNFLRWQKHQLFSFLQQTPNLSTLRVNSRDKGSYEDGIIEWLAKLLHAVRQDESREDNRHIQHGDHSKTSLPGDPKAMVLPHFEHRFQGLVELELANMSAPTRTVQGILRSLSSSLKRLTLHKIALLVRRDDNELDNNPLRPNAWSAVFLDMHASLTLEQLALSALEHYTEKCSRQNGHPVAFLPSKLGAQSGPANGLLHAWSHEDTSDTIRDFLEELHSKTIVICRRCRQRNAGYRSVEEILEL